MNLKKSIKSLVLWAALSGLMGLLGGAVGAAFAGAVSAVTNLRQNNSWLIFLLPVAGVLSVAVSRGLKAGGFGTVKVFDCARQEQQKMPLNLSVSVFIGTV